eukprot:8695683-Ditylum_brightwellii.AAC.1
MDALLMHHEEKDINVWLDFVDRLVAPLAIEIQSEHSGRNQRRSMEGLEMDYVNESNNLNQQRSVKEEFHSFLSVDSDQGAVTTALHISKLLIILLNSKWIEIGAPGHGKDVVDVLNAVDRMFL